MPDHVSPDTGARLREANLEWQPAVGDWVWFCNEWANEAAVVAIACDPRPERVRVMYLSSGVWAFKDECTWLPTTGQLLEALTPHRLCIDVQRGIWSVWCKPQQALVVDGSLPEALAEVWLRVRAQEVQP